MHRHSADLFGWTQNNTIGSTPQINTKTNAWATFFGENRLGYPLALARDNGTADSADSPVIYDPAVYYGDREVDLAMTELFGRFNDRFYHSYRHAWPWDAGYETRRVLYNLYHVLNLFNLFGGSYAIQAQDMINRLIAEVS
jgi:protein-ribulosamine 3-kinase